MDCPLSVFMPQCACATVRYSNTVVCACVCLGCYSCSGINKVQVCQDFNYKIKLRSRVMAIDLVLLEGHCKAKLVHRVLLLYLVLSSALQSCTVSAAIGLSQQNRSPKTGPGGPNLAAKMVPRTGFDRQNWVLPCQKRSTKVLVN